MKECDNSTRKVHISSNFILSISLLIMFDTLLLRLTLQLWVCQNRYCSDQVSGYLNSVTLQPTNVQFHTCYQRLASNMAILLIRHVYKSPS